MIHLFVSKDRRGLYGERTSGWHATRHQREVATAIKRGRQVALLPFTVMQHQ